MDFLTRDERVSFSEQQKIQTDTYCADLYGDQSNVRTHLGGSVIGDECSRRLWYSFRWFSYGGSHFSGRMERLFQRGHKYEHDFSTWLRGTGWTVQDRAPDGKQWSMSGVRGHYGGSFDGIGYLKNDPDAWLLEYKTHNSKSFLHLIANGVASSKPKHFAQMQTYGTALQVKNALYCALNKNDDDIYYEVVPINILNGKTLLNKAEFIIDSPSAPPRVSENPAFFECKYCGFHDICHNGAPFHLNCRTCRNSTPVDDGRWFCALYKSLIPDDYVPKGCPQHSKIEQ